MRLMIELEDTGELKAEHAKRTNEIRSLEAAIAAAQAAPVTIEATAEAIARRIDAAFDRLRGGIIGAPDQARQAFRSIFPDELVFEPDGTRWTLRGRPRLEAPLSDSTIATPTALDATWTSDAFEIVAAPRPG